MSGPKDRVLPTDLGEARPGRPGPAPNVRGEAALMISTTALLARALTVADQIGDDCAPAFAALKAAAADYRAAAEAVGIKDKPKQVRSTNGG